jgi:hypothetical protein
MKSDTTLNVGKDQRLPIRIRPPVGLLTVRSGTTAREYVRPLCGPFETLNHCLYLLLCINSPHLQGQSESIAGYHVLTIIQWRDVPHIIKLVCRAAAIEYGSTANISI